MVIRFLLRHRLLFELLFFLMLGGGIWVYTWLPVDVYPDVPFNEALVTVLWPGATAAEVELLVTQKIEEEILSVQDIAKLRSKSARDRASINVKFNEDLSAQEFQNRVGDLRGAVDRVSHLPAGVEEIVVRGLSAWEVFPLCEVVVTSSGFGSQFSPEEEFEARQVARDLLPVLRQLEGVQKVDDSLRDPEIHLDVRLDDLWQLGYTLPELAERLAQLNRDIAAGQLDLHSAQFVLNTKGGQEDPRLLEEIVLFDRDERGPVRLGDLARVSLGFEEAIVQKRFNGKPCVTLAIVKEGSTDSVRLVRAVKEAIAEFQRVRPLPQGTELRVINDTTQIIRSRLRVLRNNLLGGIVLVGLLLWLSIGAHNAFLALLGIPFSLLTTILLFPVMGLTLNAITLFSLMLVSGMIVDDAIVVLESIHHKIESGFPLAEAVTRGTSEVMGPVIGSSLTTVAAFLPMLMTDGIMGKYFAVVPKTVGVTLLASLVECFVTMPIHYLALGRRRSNGEGRQPGGLAGLLPWVADRFAWLTERLLPRPWYVVAAGTGLAVLAAGLALRIPRELFPSDFQLYSVMARLPEGSTLQQSEAAAVFIEDQLRPQVDEGEVQYCLSTVGLAWSPDNIPTVSPDLLQVLVFMHEDERDPDRPLGRTRRLLQQAIARAGAPELRSWVVWAPNDGPPKGKPVQLHMQVPDYELGEGLATQAVEFLRSLPGVTPSSVEKDLERGPLRLDLAIRPEARALDGVDETQVGLVFQAANFGLEVGTFKDSRYGEAYPIRLSLDSHPTPASPPREPIASPRREPGEDPGDACEGLAHLLASPIRHRRTGELFPLSQVARVESRSGYKWHPRRSGRRYVSVMADLEPGTTSLEVNRQLSDWLEQSGVSALAGHVSLGGEFEESNKSFASMRRAFIVALVLIYLILVAEFSSYLQPAVILVTVPFAFVGVVVGLLAMRLPFTITSLVAVIGLAGVAVNNAIVLVATVNRFRSEGMSPDAAIVEGVRVRCRPILLTSLTTIAGLLPMALGIGGFSKIWSPFAATMSFGLTSALVLTLLVVPSLIRIIDRMSRLGPSPVPVIPENAGIPVPNPVIPAKAGIQDPSLPQPTGPRRSPG